MLVLAVVLFVSGPQEHGLQVVTPRWLLGGFVLGHGRHELAERHHEDPSLPDALAVEAIVPTRVSRRKVDVERGWAHVHLRKVVEGPAADQPAHERRAGDDHGLASSQEAVKARVIPSQLLDRALYEPGRIRRRVRRRHRRSWQGARLMVTPRVRVLRRSAERADGRHSHAPWRALLKILGGPEVVRVVLNATTTTPKTRQDYKKRPRFSRAYDTQTATRGTHQ